MFNTGILTHICLSTIIMLTALTSVSGYDRCKWSNEDCEDDDDCCSTSCTRLHEGTDYRCESSPIHFPCFFSYQCEGDLLCGERYECCSSFWGVCTDVVDCCNSSLVCRQEDGFIYKRCLTASVSPQVLITNIYLLIFVVLNVFNNLLRLVV